MYARDHASTGFSPLTEMTPANVSGLKQICSYPLPENATFESSLVTINGTMYFATGAYTYALNAANCTLKWRVQHEMQGGAGTVRGVAVEGNHLFRGFRDGFVVAYNIENGQQLWATRLTEPEGIPAPIAAAPITWNGMVFVGTSGAERACGCMIAGLDADQHGLAAELKVLCLEDEAHPALAVGVALRGKGAAIRRPFGLHGPGARPCRSRSDSDPRSRQPPRRSSPAARRPRAAVHRPRCRRSWSRSAHGERLRRPAPAGGQPSVRRGGAPSAATHSPPPV